MNSNTNFENDSDDSDIVIIGTNHFSLPLLNQNQMQIQNLNQIFQPQNQIQPQTQIQF